VKSQTTAYMCTDCRLTIDLYDQASSVATSDLPICAICKFKIQRSAISKSHM